IALRCRHPRSKRSLQCKDCFLSRRAARISPLIFASSMMNTAALFERQTSRRSDPRIQPAICLVESFLSVETVPRGGLSALPPKADIERHDWHVRFVPKADICSAAICSLFDHLVGAGEH